MDKLEEIVKLQTEFMDSLGVPRIGPGADLAGTSAVSQEVQRQIPHLMFALTCELGEVGDAINWKSWKKTQHVVDMDNLRMEFIDALHFLLEMAIMCGMDADTIHTEYLKKMSENLRRQREGY